ncbi:hypothetical protein [Nonomuraea glycinis]|uniref:hypothetical protein n=1 Tax=Nonomuraea glycinis TaxID=2047744 RepID=UPI0033AAD1C8
MSRMIVCACCKRVGPYGGYGWIRSCYDRWRAADRPDGGPPPQRRKPEPLSPGEPWRPVGPHGERMIARYAEIAGLGWSRERISFELGVGDRTIFRYAAYLRRLEQEQREEQAQESRQELGVAA